jgi:PPOX class probable FMN-dependent enzyme
MNDPHLIDSLEQLRELIPSPKASVAQKVTTALDEEAMRFIAASPLVFVATVDAQQRLDVSPKGDAPGFVQVQDARTLLLPERAGNRLTFGFQNILQTGSIGLIFVVPGVRETLRINGRATLSKDPALRRQLAAGDKPALLVTRIAVEECFFHCAKAFIRSGTWEPASWAPQAAATAAIGNWSRLFGMAPGSVQEALDHDYRHNL